jgi:hypothetical protein
MLSGLGKVGCSGVDVAGAPGAAHGHIGKLPPAAVVEDVCHVDSRSLCAVSSDRIAVGEAVRFNVINAHVELATVGRDRGEGLGLRVDDGHPGSL